MASIIQGLEFKMEVTPEAQAHFDALIKGTDEFIASLTPEQLAMAEPFFDALTAFFDGLCAGLVCVTDTSHVNGESTTAYARAASALVAAVTDEDGSLVEVVNK